MTRSFMCKCLSTCRSASEKNILPIPEKRKKRARWMSIILCTTTAFLIIVTCVYNRSVVEYYPDATQKNTTNVCYREREKLTFSGLFKTALNLFGVVLGTLVDRVSLIAEECQHIKSRYDGKYKKMIKACFSGISWGPVLTLLFLAYIIFLIMIFLTGKPWFELSYLVYIFSGIGVGPLIMQLLSLNTQSEVYISTIFEEKQTNVANGLVWSYYFNYLQKALPKFNERVPRNGHNAVELEQQERVELNSNKLILLITQDCKTEDLEKLDNNIKKLGTFANGKYKFPVYELTYNDRPYRYVIQYVKLPLETLEEMSRYGRIKLLDEEQREYQVKLLYKTLFEILKDLFNKECEDKCILVGIHANSRQCLNNGQLVNVIKQQIEAEEFTLEQDGSIQVYSHKKTKNPDAKETTGDVSRVQLLNSIEENMDTPRGTCIVNKRAENGGSKMITEEVGDDASGASTSGLQINIQQQQDSSNDTHENDTSDQL